MCGQLYLENDKDTIYNISATILDSEDIENDAGALITFKNQETLNGINITIQLLNFSIPSTFTITYSNSGTSNFESWFITENYLFKTFFYTLNFFSTHNAQNMLIFNDTFINSTFMLALAPIIDDEEEAN